MRHQSFKIDRQRLRELRAEKGLTQAALARGVCDILSLEQDQETYAAIYRRIEKRGSTSRERAEAIAKILNVSLEELQGIAPPDPSIYEHRVLELIKEQLRLGNAALQSAFEKECRHGSEDALQSMAQDVARRIEAAQLARNPAELAELSQLTGLHEGEILSPANVDGYWLVVTSSPTCTRTEIVLGAAGVMTLIREIVGDRLDQWGSDGLIRMYRASPWYRLEIDQLHGRYLTRIDFVQSIPEANGLRWLNPSWRNVWWVEDPLLSWARTVSNFVTGFDGAATPSDVRRLRLRVTEYNGQPAECISEHVVAGCLETISDEWLHAYQAEGISHSSATLMLGNALRDILEPSLRNHPRQYWDVRQTEDGCAVYLWPKSYSQNISYGLRYEIQLVEELAPDKFRSVPWRHRDRAELKLRIEEWLS